MSVVRTVLVLSLGSLCACEGAPGRARIQLYDPASAEPGWEQTVPAQEFVVEPAASDGLLRIAATDYCWTSTLVIDFELDTGKALSVERRGVTASVGGGLPELDPPSACAAGFATRRITLSSGERVDLCPYAEDGSLLVTNVAGGGERFRLRPGGPASTFVAGDQLLLSGPAPGAIATHSLLSGEQLWSWTAPEPYTFVAGLDPERVFLHAESSGETHALALADGSVVWQKNLACDSLSLAGSALVCHQTLRDSSCEHG